VFVSRHFLLQAPQCPCSVRKRFSRDQLLQRNNSTQIKMKSSFYIIYILGRAHWKAICVKHTCSSIQSQAYGVDLPVVTVCLFSPWLSCFVYLKVACNNLLLNKHDHDNGQMLLTKPSTARYSVSSTTCDCHTGLTTKFTVSLVIIAN